MPRDAKRAERLVDALRKLHRMEELKKIELERQMGELRQSEEDIIARLGLDTALDGTMARTAPRFLRSLAREAERVSQARADQARLLLERAGKLRQAEKLRDQIVEDKTRQDTAKHLAEVIEAHLGRRNASLP